MLNVDTIKNGLVIYHIKAGYGPKIFSWLGLDKADFCVALIMNAPSKTQGRKDIIKIDNFINIDYSILGFIEKRLKISSSVKILVVSQQQKIMLHKNSNLLIKKEQNTLVNIATKFINQEQIFKENLWQISSFITQT